MAVVPRCCCSICQGHGLQARQGLLRAEGGGRARGLGCVHAWRPPTPLLSLLLGKAIFTRPLPCSKMLLAFSLLAGLRRKVLPFSASHDAEQERLGCM